MLRSFGDKDTQAVWERRRSRKLDAVTQRAAMRKLAMLDAAENLADLLIPPGNRLEKLAGDRAANTASASTGSGASASNGPTQVQRTSRSSTATREGSVTSEVIMDRVPPGEILLEEFLLPLGVSQYRLAKAISVPARRINEIVHGQRRISADTALRLSRFFGTSERFWLNLQARYDLEIEKDRLVTELAAIDPLRPAS